MVHSFCTLWSAVTGQRTQYELVRSLPYLPVVLYAIGLSAFFTRRLKGSLRLVLSLVLVAVFDFVFWFCISQLAAVLYLSTN